MAKITDKDMALTAERLREMLRYEPETGLFVRRVKTSPKAPAGQVVGFPCDAGYTKITLDGRRYMGHRLAWLRPRRPPISSTR